MNRTCLCLPDKTHLFWSYFTAASLLRGPYTRGPFCGLLLSPGISSIESTYAFGWPGHGLNPKTSSLESHGCNSRVTGSIPLFVIADVTCFIRIVQEG